MKIARFAAALILCAIPLCGYSDTSATIGMSSSYKSGTYQPTTYNISLDTYNGAAALNSVVLTFNASSVASTYNWNNNNTGSTAEGYVYLSNMLSTVTVGKTTYSLSDLNGVWQDYTTALGVDGSGTDIGTYNILAGVPYDTATLTISDPSVVSLFTLSGAGSSTVTFSFVSTLASSLGADVSNVVVNGTTPSAILAVSETFVAVPEPSTYALFLGAATLGLVGWRRFRRK